MSWLPLLLWYLNKCKEQNIDEEEIPEVIDNVEWTLQDALLISLFAFIMILLLIVGYLWAFRKIKF